MAKCAECTYLDLSDGNINGAFWCEKKLERHLATDIECYSFCRAYGRSYSTIENAIESSYEYSGEHAAYGVKISRQEVKNEIENLNLDIPLYQENESKKQVKNVYVIADEDHVHLQTGGMEEPRIVVVYDNFVKNGKRIELKNKRHFGGLYKGKIDDLWNE